MKAARAFICLISLLFAFALFAALCILPQRLLFKGADYYCFYLGNTSKDCREVRATPSVAPLKRVCLKEVCGESATYLQLDVESYLASVNAEILFCEELCDSVNYYCKADLPYCTELYGKQINLHVCVKESGVIVASPLIFGGF